MTSVRELTGAEREDLRSWLGPAVSLALGGGAARGFAHIGVLRALQAAGVSVVAVAGTSIGSVVGGLFCAGQLDGYEARVRAMQGHSLLKYLDPRLLGGGVFAGEKLAGQIADLIGERRIEELPVPFRAVAVDIDSGEELALESGALLPAIRASCAIPGMFQPVQVGGRWLVDGGVANPLPVSVARSLARGGKVLAVDLNRPGRGQAEGGARPSLRRAISTGIALMAHRLTEANLHASPPEYLVAPDLSGHGLFDLGAVAEVIERGQEALVEAARGALGLLHR